MRWLVDADVVLDVLADREPWVEHSARVLELAEDGIVEAFLAAHTITTLHYLIRKHRDDRAARRQVRLLLRLFRVIPVDEDRLLQALDLPVPDYEDAVQASCAGKAKADALVTRDVSDYAGIDLDVVTPVRALARVDR